MTEKESAAGAKPQPTIARDLLTGAGFGVVWMAVLWASAWTGFGWGLPPNAFERSALFGDSFAPFVGFLTAAALLLAIRGNQQQTAQLALQSEQLKLQMEELALTREELKLTRAEVKGQREAQEEQAKVARLANSIAVAGMTQDLLFTYATTAVGSQATANLNRGVEFLKSPAIGQLKSGDEAFKVLFKRVRALDLAAKEATDAT